MKNALILQISLGLTLLATAALVALHVLSPEIDPVWHMVSEYAFGDHGWVLSVFFFAWGLAYWAGALALAPVARGWTARIGVGLLFVTGLGAIMGGLFDVRHPLHGAAFAIGVPFLPIAALLVTGHLRRTHGLNSPYLRFAAHAPWVSLVLMGVTMWLFISGMSAAGALSQTPQLVTTLPDGVIAIHGIANRLLVASYLAWLALASVSLRGRPATRGAMTAAGISIGTLQ
jgi:hypothetical protein